MTLAIRSPMEMPAHPRAFRTQLFSAWLDDRTDHHRRSGVRAWGKYVSRGLMETAGALRARIGCGTRNRDDLITIPARLDALATDYDFFLDSVAPGEAGPRLFARPRPDLTSP